MAKEMKKKIVSVLVDNLPNVMTRVASVLGRRGFNIDTITVSSTGNPDITRITMVFNVEEEVADQIVAQIAKMEVVKSVSVLNREKTLYRELLLVKVNAMPDQRDSIKNIVEVYRGSIINLTTTSLVIEVTGSPEKLDGFMDLMDEFDVVDNLYKKYILLYNKRRQKNDNEVL